MRLRYAVPALLLVLAIGPWAAAGGESAKPALIGQADRLVHGTLSVDEAGVQIERDGADALVTVPVLSNGVAPVEATLSAQFTRLDGRALYDLPVAVTAVAIKPGPNEAQVRIPTVDDRVWDRPEGVVIAWSISVGGEGSGLEGRKAFGEAWERLRLLVSLPPRLVAEEPTPFQATVTHDDGRAAAGARIRIRSGWFGDLRQTFASDLPADELLFEGTADATGVVAGEFVHAGDQKLAWFTFSADLNEQRALISEPLTFEEAAAAAGRLILTTDKPAYQPSQDVRVRVVALRPTDGRPAAGESLTHVVRDPKGTLVFREDLVVDRFGVTHFTFPLADELLFGDYAIEVSGTDFLGQTSFNVDRYELPRFSPRVELDELFVAPGGVLHGRVSLAYVFGEPVRGANVVVDILRSAGDAEPEDTNSLKTRADGTAEFELSVPSHFDARALREGTAKVYLRVRAVDRAEQTAETVREVPISDGPLTIRLVAETATLVEGIPNVLHVAVSDPGGRPVEADIELRMEGDVLGRGTTDARGYARVLTTALGRASAILVVASADGGARQGAQTFPFTVGATAGFLLARPDAAIVRVGEPLTIELLGSESALVATVEIRSSGRVLDTRQVTLSGGTGQVSFRPTADALGEIEIAARALDSGGHLLQDRRTVVVDLGDELQVDVTADRSEYEPGESGALALTVTGADGAGVEAEIGITAVDEAVYLLTAGRVGTEALQQGGSGLDGTEGFAGGTPLGDILAGGRTQADQELASAILAQDRLRRGALDSRMSVLAAKFYAAEYQIYREGQRLTDLLNKKGKRARRSAIKAKRFVDPWGTPYRLKIRGKPREVLVITAGADETFSTADDLSWVFRIRPRGRFYIGSFFGDDDLREQAGEIIGTPVLDFLRGGRAFPIFSDADSAGGAPAAPETVARRFFPETLLAVPNVLTDSDGRALLPFTLADNVTTWRVAAIASSADGRIGSGAAALSVRKEMFVDLGLPRSFTQGDRIEIPIVAYNLTSQDRDVTVELRPADWYGATGGVSRVISVPAGSAARDSFGVHALSTGDVTLRVDATSDDLTDAVEMQAHVTANARPVNFTRSGQLLDAATETIQIPAAALTGETTMSVHLLPGILSQTLDGLDALLAEPHGCFEQTTSTTYPNAVVLAYLRAAGTVDPVVTERAKRFLTQGMQKLLTFEADGGGFSLWGGPEPSIILTGYALQQFADIAAVRHVDPALLQRTAAWLVAQQEGDGSWAPSNAGVHFGQSSDPLRVTAYTAWVLAETNRAPAAMDRALAFVRANVTEETDLYTRVVAANALLAADSGDRVGRALLTQLLTERVADESGTYWSYGANGNRRTLMSGSGHGAAVETTAMMVQALLATGDHADVISDVLTFLAGARSQYGGWGGTFATVWTIKAFLAALPVSGNGGNGSVEVRVNGAVAATVPLDGEDSPRVVDVSAFVVPGDNVVEMIATGTAQPYYRISGAYVIPWTEPDPEPESLRVDVALGKNKIRAGRSTDLTVSIRNNRASGAAEQVTAVVGLPPGFAVDEAQLGDLRDAGEFNRFEILGGSLNLYLGRIPNGDRRSIKFRVHPTLRGTMTLPHTEAYEYYDPESRGASTPAKVTVR